MGVLRLTAQTLRPRLHPQCHPLIGRNSHTVLWLVACSRASPSDLRCLRCYSVIAGQNGGCHSESSKRVSNELFPKSDVFRLGQFGAKCKDNADAKKLDTSPRCFVPQCSCSFSSAREESVSFRDITKQILQKALVCLFFPPRNKSCVFAKK